MPTTDSMRKSAVAESDTATERPRSGDLAALHKAIAAVSSVMRPYPTTLCSDETVHDALELFSTRGFRHLLVCDAGRLVGLVSDRDLLRFLIGHPDGIDTPVGQMMTRSPRTIRPDSPISEAASLMIRNRIHCLPVVTAAGEVEGIITSSDLLGVLHAVQYWIERRFDPSAAA